MNLPSREPMTAGEFLAWEARQELRHEFDGIAPTAMTGGTAAHAFIQRRLAGILDRELEGSPCDFYGSDLKVQTDPDGKYRYPDGFVVCAPMPPDATVVTDPVVIFEVLSPSTAGQDRFIKNQEYSRIPSVRRYVMLEAERVGATMFERVGDEWVGRLLGSGAVLAMPEIGVAFPLAALYAGLSFAKSGS